MDPLSLAVGAGLLGAGIVIGNIQRRSRRPKPVTATCECGHSLGMHEGDGRCNAKVYRGGGVQYKSSWDRCACLRYVGPQPISSMFALPIADKEV